MPDNSFTLVIGTTFPHAVIHGGKALEATYVGARRKTRHGRIGERALCRTLQLTARGAESLVLIVCSFVLRCVQLEAES